MYEMERLKLLGSLAEFASSAVDVDALLDGAARIISSGLSASVRLALADGREWSCATAEHADSALVVPLIAGTENLGVLTLSGEQFANLRASMDPSFPTQMAALIALSFDRLLLQDRLSRDAWVRSQILSTVSHDLRTPLTTIRGVTQLLLRRRGAVSAGDDPQTDARLALVDRAAVQLGGLIDEVLDFSRLETGSALELNRDSFDLNQLAVRIAAEQQATTDEHDIRVELPVEPVVGSWDGRRIGSVLAKLVSNAVRYSPSGGRVQITVSRGDEGSLVAGCACLVVSDEGAGIRPDDLPDLFDGARRMTRNGRRKRGGRLDLRGCRLIIEQHGGTMSVRREEGKGSAFLITLPLAPAMPRQTFKSPSSPRTSPTSPS